MTIKRGDDKKRDHGKPMWDLLPLEQVEHIVDVLTFGARKYGPNQWQTVEDAENRYFAALMRHLVAWRSGRSFDRESSLRHLGHAGCCLLFLMWFEDQRINTTNEVENISSDAKSPDTMSGKSVRPLDLQENPADQSKSAQTKSNRQYQEKTKVSEAMSDQPDTTRAPETPLKRPSMPLEGQFKPVSIPLKDSQNTRSKP